MTNLTRRLARAAGLLAAIALIALAALHHPWVRARVADRARAYVAREFQVALRVSTLRYNVFTRSIELRDVSAASTSASESFLQADRVVIVFGPGTLLGRPAVTSISLTRPRVTLVRDRTGAMNLPPSRGGGGSSAPLPLGTVSVTGLTVGFDDRLAQQSFTLGPIDLSMDTIAASLRPGTLGPAPFAMRAGGTELSGTLDGRVSFDGSRVTVDDLTAETTQGRAVLGGWMDVTGQRPAISSRLSASVDVAGATRLAGRDIRGLAGYVDATIDVSGDLTTPNVTIVLSSRDVKYAPVGPLQLAARSTVTGSRAVIDALDIRSPSGVVQANGALDFGTASAPDRTSHVAVRWSDLQLDDLVRASGRSLPIRSGALGSGAARIDFDARDLGRDAWSKMRASVTTTLTPTAGREDPAVLGLSGRAELALDAGRWSLRHDISARRSRADLTGTVNGVVTAGPEPRSALAGRSRMRIGDLGDLSALMESAGMAVAPLKRLTGSMSATFDLAGTTDAPRARVELAARDVRATQWPHPAVIDARLDIDASGVRASQVQAASATTSLRSSGRYAWKGGYEGQANLTQGDLSELARSFQLPVVATGSARIDATFAGTRQSGIADVAVTATDLVVDDVAIGPLDAKGRLGLVESGVFTIDAVAPVVGARAHLDIINRTDYPVSGDVTLHHERIRSLIPSRYAQQIGDLDGRVEMSATGAGRLTAPASIRGRVDVRALDVTARGTRLVLAAPGSLTVADDRIAVQSLDFRIGQRTRAILDGQVGVGSVAEPLRIRMESPLSELIEIGSRAAGVQAVTVRGDATATLDLTVGGTLRRPLPNGRLAIQASSLEYGTVAPLTDLKLDAIIDPTVINVPAIAATWRGASLAGSAAVPWRVLVASTAWSKELPAEPSRATLALRAGNVTQAVLTDFLPAERLDMIQGTMAATLTAEADGLSLERVRAAAVFDRSSLVLAGVPVTQAVPTRLRLENGHASIEAFQWNAGAESIAISGSADLLSPQPTIDAAITGVMDLRILSAFASGISSAGTAKADLKVNGPLVNPAVIGRIDVTAGELQLDTPRLAASDLSGTVQIDAGRQMTVSLAGLLNTGRTRLEGTVDLRDFQVPRGKLDLTARRVAMEVPPGLQTESNVELSLALAGATSTLTGRVDVLGGTYREALILSSQLLNFASASGIAQAVPADDWLSRMRLDVALATSDDLRIDNNYGRLDVGAALRVVGTPAAPGVIGRIEAGEDGEIYFGGRTYHIERLVIDLANPRKLAPDLDFSAQTKVGDMPIGVELRCPAAAACERKVTSLNSGDDKEAEARLFGTDGATSAGQGLARLLSGELLGVVGRTAGLDTVRLEQNAARSDIFDDPTLVAGDVDPAARLTLGKRLGSGVDVVFSQNLADAGSTWITSYTGPRGLSGRVLILDDNSRSYEFRHEPIGAGRTRQRPRRPERRIAAVAIDGMPGFSDQELRKQLQLTEGDRFNFGDWQRDRDRLARFYQDHAFLEARIVARRVPAQSENQVRLEYSIIRGPETRTVVRGATLPGYVRDRLARRWTSVLFDGFLEKDARTIVHEHLYREGRLSATVNTAVGLDPSGEIKTLTIDVVPGPIVPARIAVTGNAALSAAEVEQSAVATDALAPWLVPRSVEQLVRDHYRAAGFLAATASVSAPRMVEGTSVVTIAVTEGAPYSVGEIVVEGLSADRSQEARDTLALSAGDRYRPAALADGVDRFETRLRQLAYRQATVAVDTRVVPEASRVDMTLRVTPGPRSILRDVVVEGADASKSLIARTIVMRPGAPLDLDAIAETRRRLYGLDIYRSVTIEVQPLESLPGAPVSAAPAEESVTARISVEERPRYRFRYGIAVSDEEVSPDRRDQQLGFAADLENRNLFGRGASTGASLRLRADQQVGRVSLGAKRFFQLPIRSTLFVERRREQLDSDTAFPTTTDVSALTVEQAYRLARALDLRYGYRLEKNHTFISSEQADAFDITVNIARFITGALADRRDDAFNPSRGWFTAYTLELSTPGIGSDLKFLKNFAQFSYFVPAGHGMVVASGARVGLARTYGDEVLIPSERFYAGGANTVRGYREDALGAESILGGPEGGSALLVLNGELRFPVYRWIKGVGFVDAGNVFPTVRDFSLADLQVGLGGGARIDTPFGLLRFDFGVPANRRPIDPRWRFHFGFGHAF